MEGSSVPVNHRTSRNHYCLLVACLLVAFASQFAQAANLPISGSYEVIEKTDLGSQTKITVRLHLTNHGQGLLYLQQVLLADFAHPSNGGPRTSADATQEFVIPRSQFAEWQRGLRPRVLLQLQTATGARITQVIRLDRVPARKGE